MKLGFCLRLIEFSGFVITLLHVGFWVVSVLESSVMLYDQLVIFENLESALRNGEYSSWASGWNRDSWLQNYGR